MDIALQNLLITLCLALVLPNVLFPVSRAMARTALCDAAAREVAPRAGVPLPVMRAITRVETGRGRGLEPWPWTVNMEGKGHWFETRAEAEAFVARAMARGARSFDIGCFQINHRWHGTAFRSPSEMFDPLRNAAYAARFLKDLHAQSGNWSVAAGWFHSRTPERAREYRARFERVRASLSDAPPDVPTLPRDPNLPRGPGTADAATRAPAPNTFPLLTRSVSGAVRGSLVPLDRPAPPPFLPALVAARGS
jgi:hypothetical protein